MKFNIFKRKPKLPPKYYYYFNLNNVGIGKLVGYYTSQLKVMFAMHNSLNGVGVDAKLIIVDDEFYNDAWKIIASDNPKLSGHTVKLIGYHAVLIGKDYPIGSTNS